MSNLLGLLDLGSSALQSQTAGASVSANNAANVNTEGYSRQRVDLRAELAAPLVGGVRADGAYRYESNLLASRIRDNGSSLTMSQAFSEALLSLESTMTAPGGDVSERIANVFGRFGELSASPMDSFVRDAAVEAARDLASNMRRNAAEIEQARTDADVRVRENVAKANNYAKQIAEANRQLRISDDPVLRDRREVAAQKLTELVGGKARIDADGHMRVVLDGGSVMVDGTRAATLEATKDASLDNHYRVDVVDGSHRRNVTSLMGAGKVAGDIQFRDGVAKTALQDLDQLAFDLSTQFNATHRAGAAKDGSTGRNFFIEPTAVAGAAAAFGIDPAISADSSLVAAAAVGTGPGDNQGAQALLALRDQALAMGGTRSFTDAGIEIVSKVGRAASTAQTELSLNEAVSSNLSAMRDALSGVSIEEELAQLSKFQHAAEASTRFISTVDELLGHIIRSL